MEKKMASDKAGDKGKHLGEMLVEANLITAEQLELALKLQPQEGKHIGDILVEQGLVTAKDLAMVLSIQLNIPFVDLRRHKVQPDALQLIPESMVRKYNVVPLDIIGDALVVAMADPQNIQIMDDLAARAKMRIEPVISLPSEIREIIDLNYKVSGEVERQVSRMVPSVPRTEEAEHRLSAELVAQTPAMRIVDLLIAQGIKDHASDIHIEPQQDRVRIRFRMDGVLHDMLSLPLTVHAPLVSRIKILAEMDIAERRRPQDGQFSVETHGRDVDIRAATSETAYGEMVALRILDKSLSFLALSELGFLPDALAKYQQMLKSPFGIILVAGPTGSGKTTTLYASMNQLDSKGRNILTIEDPIEYRFADINQIQVNPRAGVTFASGLRGIMRLDPDVILIGEIRDSDTANTGIQAALTGHLVLSSIHANDAVGALFRLINLGVEPFLISSGLVGVVAQRLVRRVCPYCRTLIKPPPEQMIAYKREVGENQTQFYRGMGCNFCANTGYLGRTAVFEILIMSEEIRQMLVTSASAAEIRAAAIKEGMVPMRRHGMLKAKDGITTPYEVLRNVFSIGDDTDGLG
jgi:general secretion pathway protein E